jgi:hypothetical protein
MTCLMQLVLVLELELLLVRAAMYLGMAQH